MSTPDPDPDLAATLDAMLNADAVTTRNALQGVLARWQYVEALGSEVVGADRFRDFNYLATVAQVYYGQVGQPDPFPFDEALALVRRGQ